MTTKSLNFAKYVSQIQQMVNKVNIPTADSATKVISFDKIFPGNLKHFVQQLFWVLENHSWGISSSRIRMISFNHEITDKSTIFSDKIKEIALNTMGAKGCRLDQRERSLYVYTGITEESLYQFIEDTLLYLEDLYNGAPIIDYTFQMYNHVTDNIDFKYNWKVTVNGYSERVTHCLPEWEDLGRLCLQTEEIRKSNEYYADASSKHQLTSWNIRSNITVFKNHFTKNLSTILEKTPDIFKVDRKNAIYNAEEMYLDEHQYGGYASYNFVLIHGNLSAKDILSLAEESKNRGMDNTVISYIKNLKEI